MTTAVQPDKLRRVFELELDKGCDDGAVVGGLDSMLIRMVEDEAIPSAHPFRARIHALPRGGYRSLESGARQAWIVEVIRTLGGPSARADRPVSAAAAPKTTKPLELDDPVTRLPGIGKRAIEKFEKLGVYTAGDAAGLFPRRFNDFTDVRKISELEPDGTLQTTLGTILSSGQLRFGRRVRGSEIVINDGTTSLRIVWFNMTYVFRGLPEGEQVAVSGKVRVYRGRLQMDNPEYELVDAEMLKAGRLTPVYPATQGLSQRVIRKAASAAVEALATKLPDPIPRAIAKAEGLSPYAEAVRRMHYPEDQADADEARERLALGELMAVQAAVLMRRAEWQEHDNAPKLDLGPLKERYLASLPYTLTGAQERVLNEILDDAAQSRPMLRLLQGDVGSGKTVVAFAAMIAAVAGGHQTALMAPTEILAEQHYRTLAALLGGDGGDSVFDGVFAPEWLGRQVRVVLLKGSLTASERAQARNDTAHGGADIIIGTHALIEDGVEIPRLALAVIDEQHRFGVLQRLKLRQKGTNPHLLVMTATPIPRTLALTVYGDLEVSTIDELPPGRLPVSTQWAKPDERDEAYEIIRSHLDAKEQAFIICPLVGESEVLDVRSAEEEFERLRDGPLRGYRLALLHGRMPGSKKDGVMTAFANGDFDVLVSTSVIEVGVDVPNATVMVIEGAERFGLSQLHQFRGRVGRSEKQSYCLLFSSEEDPGPVATDRLKAMAKTTDGFALAEVDLGMRGEGETWGQLQSGVNTMLRVARLTDRTILLHARELAGKVLAIDPQLQKPEQSALAKAVKPFLERATEAN